MHDEQIFTHGWWVFGVMIGIFLLSAFWRKQPIGISLMFGAVAGGLVTGKGIPLRHLVEGSFTYLDPILIIYTAMLFMRVIQDNGALEALTRLIIVRLGRRPMLFLAVVTLFIMFPAMLTGITTTSVLTTGALMAPALSALGLAPANVGAMVALVSLMGMMAPPINLLVMLIGQGVDMPYIGFEGILSAIAFPLALIAPFSFAYKQARTADISAVLSHLNAADLPSPNWRLFSPLILVFALMILVRIVPQWIPDIGAPLIFIMGAGLGLTTGRRTSLFKAAYKALEAGLPILGLLAGIGMFLQVMTLTGVRGLLVVEVLSLPAALTYVGLLLSLPIFGGVSAFASAMVFGIPFLLALLGRSEIMVCAGLALLAGLGDLIPPSAINARFAAQVAGEPKFSRVVIKCLPFLILFAAVGLGVVYFANELKFLAP